MDARLHARLIHHLTEYDRKQSINKGYNIYALPQYFNSVNDNVNPALERGATLPDALKAGFCYPSRGLTAIARGLYKDGLMTEVERDACIPK